MAAQLLGTCGAQDLLEELWMSRKLELNHWLWGLLITVCLNFHDILRGSNVALLLFLFFFLCFDSFVSLGLFMRSVLLFYWVIHLHFNCTP